MPLLPTTGVQIDDMQAELVGAAREADTQMSQPKAPDPESFSRQIREVLAREDWRITRLSAD